VDASPLVVSVDGRVAVDLELFGDGALPRSRARALDPRPRARRLRASWRVGRLRAALPGLAEDLLARTDAELLAMPPLDELTDRQLLALLGRVGEALEAVHGHEVLLGLLVTKRAPRFTGASVALRVLANARAAGPHRRGGRGAPPRGARPGATARAAGGAAADGRAGRGLVTAPDR
jgi:pyruvate,water dikinase